jgi:hypothetical protein
MFATVRLRANKTKNCGNRKTKLMMAYKLMRSAETKWRRLRGFALLADVVKNVRFINGVKEMKTHQRATEWSPYTTFDNSSFLYLLHHIFLENKCFDNNRIAYSQFANWNRWLYVWKTLQPLYPRTKWITFILFTFANSLARFSFCYTVTQSNS